MSVDPCLLTSEQVRAYLDRLGFQEDPGVSLKILRGLHHCHLLSVPFENLDIHHRIPIVLDSERWFEKIVRRQRGGICYELNGLFGSLLASLGFRVTYLSAQVAQADQSYSPDYDHLLLQVMLEESWLADVGFGRTFWDPLCLSKQGSDSDNSYCLDQQDPYWKVQRKNSHGFWIPQFRFTLDPRSLLDFQERCDFHQYSFKSLLAQKRFCTRATPHGHITLTDRHLIQVTDSKRQERSIQNNQEFQEALQTHFHLQLDPGMGKGDDVFY